MQRWRQISFRHSLSGRLLQRRLTAVSILFGGNSENCLEVEEQEILLGNQDSFLALKEAELPAESTAARLASKRWSQPGEMRRSFRFPGHRRLCREIDILHHARQLVHKVVGQASEIVLCPHRVSRPAK